MTCLCCDRDLLACKRNPCPMRAEYEQFIEQRQKGLCMKPTVGRIVHYIPEWAGANGASVNPLPAIVIAVYDDNTVALGVFGRSYYPATAIYHAAQANPGTWFWPPRETP